LNRLAKQHFSEALIDTGPGHEKIEELTIKPPYANLEIDKERSFSVYAPITIVGIGSVKPIHNHLIFAYACPYLDTTLKEVNEHYPDYQ